MDWGSIVSYHGINELHTIVLWRVVTGGNHDTNRLAIEFPRSQGGEQANTMDNGIEQISGQK